MPKRAERKLRVRARKLGLTGRRRRAYIDGTLARIKQAQTRRRRRR